jgi:hypothetical protein
VATPENVYSFDFSSGKRVLVNKQSAVNLINTPNANSVAFGVVSAGGNAWSITLDSLGGISFGKIGGCQDNFSLDFSLYVQYNTTAFAGLGKAANNGVIAIGNNTNVVIGAVQGQSGIIPGVISVTPSSGVTYNVVGAAAGEGGGIIVQTMFKMWQVGSGTTPMEPIATVGAKPGGDWTAFFTGLHSLTLPKSVQGSSYGGALISTLEQNINIDPWSDDMLFFDAPNILTAAFCTANQFNTSAYVLDAVPTPQTHNSTVMANVVSNDRAAFYLTQFFVYKQTNTISFPTGGLKAVKSFTVQMEYGDSAVPIFTQTISSSVENIASVMIRLENGLEIWYGVLDFNLTGEPASNVIWTVNDSLYKGCSLMQKSKCVCNLYPFSGPERASCYGQNDSR